MASACGDLCTREPCNNRYCTAYDDEHRCRESQRSRDNESRDLRGLGPGRRNVRGKRGLSGKRFRSFVVSTQIVYGPWFPCNCPALCNWFALPAGFSNISTGFVYGEPSVYRVPEPVILEQPVVQYPGTAFRWRY